MPYELACEAEAGVIVARFSGLVVEEEIVRMFADVVAMAAAKRCFRWIHDFTDARRDLSTMAVYRLPGVLAEMAASLGEDRRRIRRALVGAAHLRDFRFAEDVAFNAGQHLRAFATVAEARRWLGVP